MYYIIVGLPLAAVFAVLQVFICEKTNKNIIKLLPIFCSAATLLLAAFIRGENLLASAVYGIFGIGIFALVVLLRIIGGAAGAGSIIGWAIYLIRKKLKN